MTPMLGLILFVIFFALMVILSGRLKMPIGLLGLLFAFILTGWFAGGSPMTVVNYFPLNTIVTLFLATCYFCYINQTGVFTGIVDRILHACRGKTWFIPFAIFLCSLVVTAIGGAEAAPMIISPLAFALATVAGMNPLLALCVGYFGTSFIGVGFWTSGGSSFRALVEAAIGETASYTFTYETLFLLAIFYVAVLIVFYFVLKGNKLDKDRVALAIQKTPEPFTREQKFALYTLAFVMVFTIVPTLFQTLIYSNPITGWLATHLSLKQNCLIGILLFHIAKVGDVNDVFKNRIPWMSFINIAGCCMIVNCTKDLGVIDLLSGALTQSIPAWFIPAAIVAICALLSFVSNAFAIIPMFAPMAAALAVATGLHESTICACILAGCIASGLSPVSMGGSLWQIGASQEQRDAIFKKQWLSAVIIMVALTVVSALGAWHVVDALFY